MQFFEWHCPDDGSHWKRLKQEAKHLSDKGVTAVWIPPCFKAVSSSDVGYGVYDLFDLGEFDQKGSIRTKYGTKEELQEAIKTLHEHHIQVYADVVLNHKGGADEVDTCMAVEVNPFNRHEEISEPKEIEAWTNFSFPGRNNCYSDFKWDWTHFSGVDRDEKNKAEGIFRLLGKDKGWADDSLVDTELGNYDYLMHANIDYSQPEVKEHIKEWAKWFVKETGVDGFRLDALKHIDSEFIEELIVFLHNEFGEDFFIVGEYWRGEYKDLENYLEKQKFQLSLMDVQLHFSFHYASVAKEKYDLRHLLDESLMLKNDTHAVTFVDNHDSQIGQSLESEVESWFKPLAYGWILLSEKGYPCIFYGDYYGRDGFKRSDRIADVLDVLMDIRKRFAYGSQDNYIDNSHCIGFVRRGDDTHPDGCVMLLSNGEENGKEMFVGKEKEGNKYIDVLKNRKDVVTIRKDGYGFFPVNGGSISVWINKEKATPTM